VIDRDRVIAERRSAELKATGGAGTLQVWLVDSEQRRDAERLPRSCWPSRSAWAGYGPRSGW
jgi:hypothetical protein